MKVNKSIEYLGITNQFFMNKVVAGEVGNTIEKIIEILLSDLNSSQEDNFIYSFSEEGEFSEQKLINFIISVQKNSNLAGNRDVVDQIIQLLLSEGYKYRILPSRKQTGLTSIDEIIVGINNYAKKQGIKLTFH